MVPSAYIACTRMYNICEPAALLWDRLIAAAARLGGVPLRPDRHPYPLDIEDLWNRDDLGLTFICGRPFALGGMRHKVIAAPLRILPDMNEPAALYGTVILVRDDSPFRSVADILAASAPRIGWTVPHSNSGYLALKRHLEEAAGRDVSGLLGPDTGPLHTPANCLKALRDGAVDAAPMDEYCHTLLLRHAPERLDGVRVLERTRYYPVPLLVASPNVDDATCERIRHGLFAAAALPEMAPVLEGLRLAGFVVPDLGAYAALTEPGEIAFQA